MVTIKEHNKRYLEAMDFVLESRGLTIQMYADALEINRTLLSHIRNGKQNASIDLVSKTVSVYPEINADYIITGRGSMFIQELENHETDEIKVKNLIKALEEATDRNKELEEENKLFRAAFAKLQAG